MRPWPTPRTRARRTTKDVGLGTTLGLATARRIVVDRHDGSLTLQSASGRTVFRVRLPLTQSPSNGSAGAPTGDDGGAP